MENNKKDKLNFCPSENTPFDGDMTTKLMSSVEAAELVSSLFSVAFGDYCGCNVLINDGRNPAINKCGMPIGVIYVDVYFKDRGNVGDAIKSIILKNASENDKSDGASLASRYARTNASFNRGGRMYKVTKDTYDALDDFVIKNGRFNWYDLTEEITTNMSTIGSKEEIITCIHGLNLDKILGAIYGNKTSEGKFEYAASPSTRIPNSNEFIMQVTQLNLAAVRKLQRELGIYSSENTMFHSCH